MRLMNNSLLVLGIVMATTTLSFAGVINNGSFESGLTGWTLAGNVGRPSSTFGKTPTAGARMAYMISQNTLVPGVTTAAAGGSNTAQVSAATLASALGTTTASLNTAAGAGNSATTGVGAQGGSGIFQSISVNAGDTLSFQWSFLTTEDPEFGPGSNNPYNNDFAFISLNGAITVLGRVNELASDSTDKSAFQYIPFTGGAVDGSNVETFLFETGDGTGSTAIRSSDYESNTGTSFGSNKFSTFSVTFPTDGTVSLGLGVINVDSETSTGSGTPSALIVDNLQLVAAVPEPGTLTLLLGGAIGLVAMRRRVACPKEAAASLE